MQGYSKGSVRPFIACHYNGQVEVSIQGYIRASVGTTERSIIMVNRGLNARL
jgi:hypothetical protein